LFTPEADNHVAPPPPKKTIMQHNQNEPINNEGRSVLAAHDFYFSYAFSTDGYHTNSPY